MAARKKARSESAERKDLRPQVTAHVDRETRDWLDRYAKGFKLSSSELLRLLIKRERRVGWLKSAFELPDAHARLIFGPPKTVPQERSKRRGGRA